MKKAKITLVTLALLTTVGAVLAFKAQKFSGEFFCTTTQGGTCAKDTNGNYIKFLYAPQVGIQLYCTFENTACSTVTTTLRMVVDPR